MAATQLMSLVDYAAHIAGCTYVSDLHYLDAVGKCRIARALEKVELDAFPLRDWNDALEYIAGAKNTLFQCGAGKSSPDCSVIIAAFREVARCESHSMTSARKMEKKTC